MSDQPRTCKNCIYWPCALKPMIDLAPKCAKFRAAGQKKHLLNVAGIRLPRIKRIPRRRG